MPNIIVKITAGRPAEQKRELVDVLTAGMVKVLDVAPESITIHIEEYTLENIAKGGKLFLDTRKK
ncbi:MAG: tautomerase family protein [Chloroflexi bacterium]|nr:tautomerase family protein [Chloroflexota bacterium]